MSYVRDAVVWLGADPLFSLFAVVAGEPVLDLGESVPPCRPRQVRDYVMTDEDGWLPGRSVVELDLVYDEVPEPLAVCLEQHLRAAVAAGALVAWFAFEGSFHFEHLLTPDTANQVYAVADASGVALALEDEVLTGPEWPRTLDRFRRAAGLPEPRPAEPG